MSTTPLLAFNSIYPTMIKEFRVSPTQLSRSAGWAGLAIALAVFLVVPASSLYGRRPMLFYSNLLSEPSLPRSSFGSLTSADHPLPQTLLRSSGTPSALDSLR